MANIKVTLHIGRNFAFACRALEMQTHLPVQDPVNHGSLSCLQLLAENIPHNEDMASKGDGGHHG
jgi:hypothetical protein